MNNMPYLIAEIGINHNGNLETALELIKKAKEVGFNCVKFQKRNPDICVPEEVKNTPRSWKNQMMTYLEYKKDIEFNKEEYDVISAYCIFLGIDWTASIWDLDSLEFMKQYPEIPFIKVPSALVDNEMLIEELNKWGKPVVISDGMLTTSEFMDVVIKYENLWGILHTNSNYPCNEKELDLNILSQYDWFFNGDVEEAEDAILIGYSGHEKGYDPTIIAVSAGAQIIERHITLDKNSEGTDHKASLEAWECSDMIDNIKYVLKVLGNHSKTKLYSGELEVARKLKNVN